MTVADRPSCRPLASSAVTAKYGPSLFTEITVSKPPRGCDPAASVRLWHFDYVRHSAAHLSGRCRGQRIAATMPAP